MDAPWTPWTRRIKSSVELLRSPHGMWHRRSTAEPPPLGAPAVTGAPHSAMFGLQTPDEIKTFILNLTVNRIQVHADGTNIERCRRVAKSTRRRPARYPHALSRRDYEPVRTLDAASSSRASGSLSHMYGIDDDYKTSRRPAFYASTWPVES